MSDTLLGVLIGGFVTIAANVATEIIRAWRESRLDRDKRANDRQIDRNTFQRATLLQLQDALTDWAQVRTEMLIVEVRGLEETGRSPASRDLEDRAASTDRLVSLLAGRILDHRARELVKQAQTRGLAMSLMTETEEEARAAHAQTRGDADAALEYLGQLFRSLW